MEYFAALGLALVLWVPALLGGQPLTILLRAPLEHALGPIVAGVLAGFAIAAVATLGVALVLLAYQAVQPAGRSTVELVRLAYSRSGNGLHAAIAVCAPLFVVVHVLAVGPTSPILGELIALAVLLSLAGLQCLRPASYSSEVWPSLRSLPRQVGHLWRARPTQAVVVPAPPDQVDAAASTPQRRSHALARHLLVRPPDQP